MKKIHNKFIIVVIFMILGVLGIEIYKNFSNIDRNSYISVIEGEGFLNDKQLKLQKKYKLNAGDIIKTIGDDSLAILKWGDSSITRIGGNSEVLIKQVDIDKNLINIKIIFELKKGKTWSDVVSFVGGNSYFYQEFADTTAAVRGTIYEVNLDKNYLYVLSHELELTKGDKKQIIGEKKAFNIKNFSFIEFLEFLKKYKDLTWQKINKSLDKQFYKDLLDKLGGIDIISTDKIKYINTLNNEEREKLYLELKKQYQQLNFVKPDSELYISKLELKKYLIELSGEKEKEDLIVTSLYDFNDIINTKHFDLLQVNLEILGKNIGGLKNLNINIEDYINLDSINNIEIPKGFKKEFENNLNSISDIFDLGGFDLSNNKVIDFIDKTKGNFENEVEKSGIFNTLKQFILKLFK